MSKRESSATAAAPWPPWCCPEDGTELIANGTELHCPQRHVFQIEHGIPRFLSGPTYADAFGEQWKRYRLTQLDSHSGTTISADRARHCLGEALWGDLPGLDVLECGCGAGRFTEVLLARGARVTSTDLSTAVEANAQTFPPSEMHRIAQADLNSLPFAPRQFDVVFCLGVIQHTPDPEAAIRSLYDHVKPGSWLVIDIYAHSLSWYTKLAPLVRQVLRRLPADAGMRWTERLTRFFFPLHRYVRNIRPAQMLLSRISPVQVYFRGYPQLADELQWEWALLDTHDSLTDWYKHFRTRSQVERALRETGASEIWCENAGNGIEARARRPVESRRSLSAS